MTEYVLAVANVVIAGGVLISCLEYLRRGRHQTRQDQIRYRQELADYVSKSSGDILDIVNTNDNKLRELEKEMKHRVTRLEERLALSPSEKLEETRALPPAAESSLSHTEGVDTARDD